MLEHRGQAEASKDHLRHALARDPQLTAVAQMLVRLSGDRPNAVTCTPN